MIDPALLADVLDRAARHADAPADALAGHLRGAFPGVHFTVCSDDDIPARLRAVAGNAFCRLYYVDGSGHCLTLTADAAAATGLVVALGDGDEEPT
jgi:hypothetical protein